MQSENSLDEKSSTLTPRGGGLPDYQHVVTAPFALVSSVGISNEERRGATEELEETVVDSTSSSHARKLSAVDETASIEERSSHSDMNKSSSLTDASNSSESDNDDTSKNSQTNMKKRPKLDRSKLRKGKWTVRATITI